MKTINIREAKAQLSMLVEQAAKGEAFMIAKAGTALVKVTRLDVSAPHPLKKLGFMAGQVTVPDDFDQMGRDDIVQLFGVAK